MNTPTQNEYLLLISGTEWWRGLSPEQLQTEMGKFKGWFDRLTESGKLKGAQPLVRDGATVSKGGRVVADGPFAESKEAIGGYFLLQLNTIEEAIEIAKSCPALSHDARIEVRPVGQECPMMEHARQLEAEEQLQGAAA
jgi:hypothetical protein